MKYLSKWHFAGALTLLSCSFLAGCEQATSSSESAVSVAEAPAVSVDVSEVPVDVQRRALRHFEEVRSAGIDWQNATLAPYAVPMMRPDVSGIAYYEFSAFNSNGEPSGYLIVANGEHDTPLPVVSQSGPSPSARLRAQTRTEPSRYYMVDTLSFAAEDAQGELLAKLGSFPEQLDWDAELADLEPEAFEGFTDSEQSASVATDDSHARLASVVRRGYAPSVPFEAKPWKGWKDLKAAFKRSYAPLIAEQIRHAKASWERESALNNHGEALAVGEARWIPALEDYAAEPQVSGSGKDSVQVIWRTLESGGSGLLVEVVAPPPSDGAAVDIQIAYASGRSETLKFGLFTAIERPAAKLGVPPRLRAVEAASDAVSSGSVRLTGHPGTCVGPNCPKPRMITAYEAWYPEVPNDTSSDNPDSSSELAAARKQQAWYGQLEKDNKYNPYNCVSGCGGTAWAMLIAWADNRAAHKGSAWEDRWGLYRQNVGEYPAKDALAPLNFSDPGAQKLVGDVAGELEAVLAACKGEDQRWTAPRVMDDIADWIHARSWANIHTTWNTFGGTSADREQLVLDEIRKNNRPAIAGIGRLKHYTLVYGIEMVHTTIIRPGDGSSHTTTERWRVNNGWGSQRSSDATIDPYAFFVGRLSPGPSDKSDSQKPPKGSSAPANPQPGTDCVNGQTTRNSCPSGQTGAGITRECINGRWIITSRACSSGSSGGGGGPDEK